MSGSYSNGFLSNDSCPRRALSAAKSKQGIDRTGSPRGPVSDVGFPNGTAVRVQSTPASPPPPPPPPPNLFPGAIKIDSSGVFVQCAGEESVPASARRKAPPCNAS